MNGGRGGRGRGGRAARAFAFGALLLCMGAVHGRADDAPPPEPEDYRDNDYRAPTPATLRGARVLTTAEAETAWRRGEAAFVDVLPQAPKPANLPPGTLWVERPRRDIPGSIWLPDTGYGRLAPATEDYFKAGLRAAIAGDPGRLLVIYCLRHCWMSWNAAKRALTLGYANVAWYPDGTDGWQEGGLPLAETHPAPRASP